MTDLVCPLRSVPPGELLPMPDKPKPTDLERVQELFAFLQGKIPEGYKIPKRERPKLTAEQAWTVVWYLAGLYWQVPDDIYCCDVCGRLYDGGEEGHVRDEGKLPVFFCGPCWDEEPEEDDDAEMS